MVHLGDNMAIKDIFLNEWLMLVFNDNDNGTKKGYFIIITSIMIIIIIIIIIICSLVRVEN